MRLFKYTMNLLYTRVTLEWKDLSVTYPLWLTRVVMDDVYYAITLVATCVASFAVGVITGIVWTVV